MAGGEIEVWVNQNVERKQFRQAVHTILYAISSAPELQEIMVMKGGILLALGYQSTRYTKDIDFSTEQPLKSFDAESFIQNLSESLVGAVEKLEYGVNCLVQRWEQRPPQEDATFPTFQIRIGYADQGDQKAHRRLLNGKALQIVKVDFSLNEPRGEPELFEIDDGSSIQIYSFHDLVAEKFRAVLQQEVRNRLRRQDIYDLHFLLKNNAASVSIETKSKILNSLKEKSSARDLPVGSNSMENDEIFRRSQKEYGLLEREIEGPLPKFEDAFSFVRKYYESLPWD